MKLRIKYFILVLPLLISSCNILNPVGGNHISGPVYEVGSINTDGSNQKIISNNGINVALTGNYIIYNDGYLTETNLDGSKVHRLLPYTNLNTHDFSISPYATKIAFSTGPKLYVMNINGGGLTQVSLPDSITNVINPNISFNDSEIVFFNKNGLYEMNIDGKGIMKLRSSPLDSNITFSQPLFSANDQNIIYATFNKSAYMPIDLHSLNLKDLSDTAFYNFGSIDFTSFEISPQNILLLQSSNSNIYSIDLNNFNVTQVAKGFCASYSFDYKKITYEDVDPPNIIYIMDLNSKVTTKVSVNFTVNLDITIYATKLSFDGTTLLYTNSRMVPD